MYQFEVNIVGLKLKIIFKRVATYYILEYKESLYVNINLFPLLNLLLIQLNLEFLNIL